MNFHDNEFCAILICFIGHKVYIKEWKIWCGLGVKILNIYFIFVIHNSPFLVFKCAFDH
jgi:hypothetical protein